MGALASLAGGVIGNIAASGDQDKAQSDKEAALNGILNTAVPDIAEQNWDLNQEAVQGTLNPEMEGTVQQGPSAMEGISTDPRLRQAQMAALSSLMQQGQGGLTATDRMNLRNITNQTEGDANAASKAIMANMAARGMAGGGAQLAAQLAATQGAANRGAANGMSVASQAQQKALQALAQGGALGTQLESQQFGEQAQQAQAQDAISRFNAANRQAVLGANTTASNQAQAANLANKQAVANANTGIANAQEEHNKNLYQQQFTDSMSKANAAAGQYNSNAQYYGDQAQATRGMWAGIGNSVNSMTSGGDFKNLMGNIMGGVNGNGGSEGDWSSAGEEGTTMAGDPGESGGGGGGGGGLGGLMSLAAIA